MGLIDALHSATETELNEINAMIGELRAELSMLEQAKKLLEAKFNCTSNGIDSVKSVLDSAGKLRSRDVVDRCQRIVDLLEEQGPMHATDIRRSLGLTQGQLLVLGNNNGTLFEQLPDSRWQNKQASKPERTSPLGKAVSRVTSKSECLGKQRNAPPEDHVPWTDDDPIGDSLHE